MRVGLLQPTGQLAQEQALQRERGLPIYNLADVFADQKGTIYADHIHVVRSDDGESPGNRILAARIGELLAETWGLQKKP